MKNSMIDRKDNCFNFIRLIAAFEVFSGHASEHLFVQMPAVVKEIWQAFRGVPIFFILSGFLIWNSLEGQTDFFRYCKKRIFRLFPELWGGVLLNAIIMLFIYGNNIQLIPFLLFQITQSTVLQFWTPDSLRAYGCGTPNGALWTIGVMVQSYIVIYMLYKFLHNKKAICFLSVLGAGIVINIGTIPLSYIWPEMIYKLFTQTFLPYIWLFVFGAAMCEYFDKLIKLLKRYWVICLIILLAVSASGLEDGIGIYGTIASLMLGFSIIGFGYSFKLKIKYDLSYGIYIYHMIVINLMAELGIYGKTSHVIAAGLCSAALAALSYITIGYISRKARNNLNQA